MPFWHCYFESSNHKCSECPPSVSTQADRWRLHSSMAWFTLDWFSSHHTVKCAHRSGYVINFFNFITVACIIFSRLKWYKNYKNRLRLAKVIVKNKMSRIFMVHCVVIVIIIIIITLVQCDMWRFIRAILPVCCPVCWESFTTQNCVPRVLLVRTTADHATTFDFVQSNDFSSLIYVRPRLTVRGTIVAECCGRIFIFQMPLCYQANSVKVLERGFCLFSVWCVL